MLVGNSEVVIATDDKVLATRNISSDFDFSKLSLPNTVYLGRGCGLRQSAVFNGKMREVSLWLENGLDLESMDLFMQNPSFHIFTVLQHPPESKEEGKEEGKGKEEEKPGRSCSTM